MEPKQITLTQTALITRVGIIAIIGVCVGLFVAYLLFRPRPYNFTGLANKLTGPVPVGVANISLRAYRDPQAMRDLADNWEGKVEGIIHDTAAFDSLYNSIFLRFARTHNAWPNRVWTLGLYPNVIHSDNKTNPRLNIYFIPTMYDTITGKVDDYYSVRNSPRSPYKVSKDKADWKDEESFIFDQGTLFP